MARRITLDFLKTESGSGWLLAISAALAMLAANSPWSAFYFAFIGHTLSVRIGDFGVSLTVVDWVKQGLMAVFFLVVGLEIKFEILRGELSSPRRLALPLFAAAGGMIVPALIYRACNLGPHGEPVGWPVPIATDIAFALAALAMAAPKLPSTLRVFLLTLAIADDLGAVALIALLFNARLHLFSILAATSVLAGMALISRWKRAPLMLYGLGFALTWAFVLKSGIDTSIAGIACALTLPIGARRAGQTSVLQAFIDTLHPYVAFAILPLFAFTEAGFPISGDLIRHALSPLPIGIFLGLCVGKPLGIFSFSVLGAVTRLGRKPTGSTWPELLGVAMLCGAGFTLSLYIGALAFGPGNASLQPLVRLGVIAGTVTAILTGGILLRRLQYLRDGVKALP